VNKTPNARAYFQAVLEAKEVLSDASKRGIYDVVWARENAGWIAAEKLRKQREKQQEEEREREERKFAKQMEEKQRREKEEAEKRAKDRERQQAASRAAVDREA
jgi:curved DNA-binding protein CbpA